MGLEVWWHWFRRHQVESWQVSVLGDWLSDRYECKTCGIYWERHTTE